MPWLRHFALLFVFVTALFRPAAAGAFVSAPDAGSQARVGAFELVAATLVGPASAATCGTHEGIGAAYDENASGYRFAARGAAQSAAPAARAAGVQANRTAGNAFRDEIAEALRSEGREVATEVYKSTPFGRRFIDIEVSQNGQVLGGIETKLGGSRYTPAQRAKDAWLWLTERYRVDVVRGP
jgi:hypothetical protein